jgi:hypothetical protein
MDPAYISALAALAGSVIGGLTSLGASWLSQNAQMRAQQLLTEKERRQRLYNSFIEEAARLYGEALATDRAEIAKLVAIYAMVGQMRIFATPAVVVAAERVVRRIVDTYYAPNKTLRELRGITDDRMDLLYDFSEACRDDLQHLRT